MPLQNYQQQCCGCDSIVRSGRPKYVHDSLDQSKGEIRLLKINRDLSDNQLIQLDLSHTSLSPTSHVSTLPQKVLSSDTKYNALSYVWGADEPSHEVLVNDCSLLIRHNLFMFLCQARKRHRSRRYPIWIDALSICQDDTEERNHQVSRMREIYKGANEVFVWLGWGPFRAPLSMRAVWRPHQIPGIRWAVPYIRQICKAKELWPTSKADHVRCACRAGKWMPHFMLKLLLHIVKLDKTKLGHNLPEFFFAVADAQYWNRAWVVQECLLAKRKHVFIGDFHMSWRTFQRQLWLFGSDKFGMSMCSFINPALDERCSSLADYWEVFQNKHCAEPRDQFYAFAGLSTNPTLFPVDYGCTNLVAFLNSTFFVCYDYCCREERDIGKVLNFAQAVTFIVGTSHSEGQLSFQAEPHAKPGFDDIRTLPKREKNQSSGLQHFTLTKPYLMRGPYLHDYGMDRVSPNEDDPDYHRLCVFEWPPVHKHNHRLPNHQWLSLLGFRTEDILLPCNDKHFSSYAMAVILRRRSYGEYLIVGRLCANVMDVDWACEVYSDSGLPGVVGWRVDKCWMDEAGTALWQIDYGLALQLVFTDLRAFVILFGLSAGFASAETYFNWDRKTHYRETAIQLIASDAQDFNYVPEHIKYVISGLFTWIDADIETEVDKYGTGSSILILNCSDRELQKSCMMNTSIRSAVVC